MAAYLHCSQVGHNEDKTTLRLNVVLKSVRITPTSIENHFFEIETSKLFLHNIKIIRCSKIFKDRVKCPVMKEHTKRWLGLNLG